MSEPNPDQVKRFLVELKLDNSQAAHITSISELKLQCKEKPQFVSEIVEALVKYMFTEKPVDCDAMQDVLKAIFLQDKMAFLNAVLKNHPTRLYPEKAPPVMPSEERELFKTNLVKRRIADLIEKSLEIVSKEELQQLAEFVEAQAGLDPHNYEFDVSDTKSVERFLSCLQMAVPLFVRGAPSSNLLDYVNNLISLPDFDQLSEQRKLDFFKALAEISSHTTPQVAGQMLPSIVELLKKYITQTENEEFKSFTYVECLLYVLHHLALKVPDVAKSFCNEAFMSRFKRVSSITQARMKKLAKTLPEDDKEFLEAERCNYMGDKTSTQRVFKAETMRQSKKTELRSCNNILALTELLKKNESCFVKLSWKEAGKAVLPSEEYRHKRYSRAPERSADLKAIIKENQREINATGLCNLSNQQVRRLLGSKHVSFPEKGPWVLSDNDDIAMLCCYKESDLSFLKNTGKKGRSGKVRDQMYHLACWIYAGSDIVNGLPLCPWYLCAYCYPSKLGKDERTKKPDDMGRMHHCYGATIEQAVHHIQINGAPKEVVSNFLCTDHQPPSADEPSMQRRKIPKPRRIETLKEVVQVLQKYTVGADLIYCNGLMELSGEYVYIGPMAQNAFFISYHAVVIEEIKRMNNEWVAVCKMSNGELVADNGYCYVSLKTRYLPVGASDLKYKFIRGSSEPIHLLTNFVIAEMKDANENEEQNWESNDREEDAKDEKPSEEKPKPGEKRKKREEKKHTPKRKRNRPASGTRLRDMIRVIRACKTAAEERAVVRKECADIRALINEDDPHDRHRNLSKLMFIHMLGYPTHFGQMECLKLIASPGFPEKRIGYLGLMLLLDERQEVLMLVTNSLKQDLNHSNQYVVGLALCALGNICSAEMAFDLAPEVERLIQFRDPNIRKKAALCSTRIVRKVPDLAENFVNAAASLLKEKHHGVLITGVQLCYELCTINDEALEYFRKKCTEGVIKTLRDITNSAYQPEYDVAGITDPFLHIWLLRLLRVLGQGDADASDLMTDILAQVATKTESNKSAGNAVLNECVETIMAIEDTSSLRVLLGRFLSNRDNNIRYVSLNMLMKSITFDDQAVQRHRVTILECVKDPDASIRKRALELVTLLVNENNVTQLTKELIDYLELSDEDFKEDLSAKICFIVEKFSPQKLWYIDQMLKVLCEAGKFVKDDVWHALIVVISNASELHGYTVRALYKAVWTYSEQILTRRPLFEWRYGDLLVNNVGMLGSEDPITVTQSDAVDVIEDAITRYNSDSTTKAMALVALLKLSSRLPVISERIKDIIVKQKGSLLLEMQQRAIEYNFIVDRHKNIRYSLVSFPASASTMAKPSVSLPNGVGKTAVGLLVDLLDLNSDYILAAPSSSGADFLQDLLGVDFGSSSSQSGATEAPKTGIELLLDILSIGTPLAQNSTPSIDLLPTHSEQETLVLMVIWCIGKYGDLMVNNVGMLGIEDPITVTECDVEDVIEDAITRHNSDMSTKVMALDTPLKLLSHVFSILERIKDIIVKQKGSLNLEMQQRAIEFNSIVDRHTKLRSSLVERMSEVYEATFNVRRGAAAVSTISKPSVSIPNAVAAAPLFDVDSDDILAAPSSSGADFLQDLLGVDLGSSSGQSEEISRVISF